MSSKILANEKYANDAISSHYSILNQGIQRRKENYFWEPKKDKNGFGTHGSQSTRMFETKTVNDAVDNNTSLLNKKLFPPDSTKNYSMKTSQPRNVYFKKDSKMDESVKAFVKRSDDGITSSNNQTERNSMNDTTFENYIKMDTDESKQSNFSNYHSDMMSDEENSVCIEKQFNNTSFEEMNSELKAVSDNFKNKISNGGENVNEVIARKRQRHKTNEEVVTTKKLNKWYESKEDCEYKSNINVLKSNNFNDDDYKHNRKSCQQKAQDDLDDVTSTKFSNQHHLKMKNIELLGDSMPICRIYSGVQSKNEENCVDTEEELFVENTNIDYVEQEKMGSEFNSYTQNIQGNVNRGTVNKELECQTNEDVCMTSENMKDDVFKSHLKQSESAVSTAITADIKDLSIKKPDTNKTENEVSSFKSKIIKMIGYLWNSIRENNDNTVDRIILNKSDSSSTYLKETPTCVKNNKIKEECFEFQNSACQEIPKTADKIIKEIKISENDQQLVVNVTFDKQDTVTSEELHRINNLEIKDSEKTSDLKIKRTISMDNLNSKESSNYSEFIMAKVPSGIETEKSPKIKRHHARLPPRFRNSKEKNNASPIQESVLKIDYSKSKSSTEDLKGKMFKEKNNLEIKDSEKTSDLKIKRTISMDKDLNSKESSNCSEFIMAKVPSGIETKKSPKMKKHHARLPPRFRNSKEKNNASPIQEDYSKSKSSTEDLKEKTFKEKNEKFYLDKSFNSQYNHCFSIKDKTQLSIRITDDKSGKDYEFMADSAAIPRIKKSYPKLLADIPDVDSGPKEIHYSANVMNIILRSVFCESFKITDTSPITNVEVLVAAQSWNIKDRYKYFQDYFFRDILNANNAGSVFSYAYNYNLTEVCNACKDLSSDNIVPNTIAPRKRQKTCFVSISTYIEPSEINILFEPTEIDLSVSFKKKIQNEFTFKAISGCYSITGFQIQLNENYVNKKGQNEDMLEIEYSIKNLNDYEEIKGEEKKPMRSINVIYFKKNLVIRPKEIGKIIIETDIEPYFCSASMEIKKKVKDSVGELELMMKSNRKVKNPERELFLVGKFFYVTKV